MGGFLIPKTFAPTKAEIWILTGSHLSLSGYIDGLECRVSTVITTPYGELEAPSAVIFISEKEGERELESEGLAKAFVPYPSRNVTVVADVQIGFYTLPEWRRDDVEMLVGTFHCNARLIKDELKRVVAESGDLPIEDFEIDLLSLEEAEVVRPPYNLTCSGMLRHKLGSSIDSLQREHVLTFWSLGIEENGIWVTQYADPPLEELLIVNPWLKILERWRIVLTVAGLIALVLLSRAMVRSRSEPALKVETTD